MSDRLTLALAHAKARWSWDDESFIAEVFPRHDHASMTPESVIDALADRYDLFDPHVAWG